MSAPTMLAAPAVPTGPTGPAGFAGPASGSGPRNRIAPAPSTSPVRRALLTVRLEVRKLRRRRYWLMASASAAILVLWSGALMNARAHNGAPVTRITALALNEAINLLAMLMPVVTAILASRLVSVDSEERMGQLMTSLGQRPTARFWGKLLVLTVTVVTVQMAVAIMPVALGPSIGLTGTASLHSALAPALVVSTSSAVAVGAFQLALSTCVSRQSVALGAAAVGGLVCSGLPFMNMEPLGWPLPWGLATAANPFDVLASRTSAQQVGDMTLIAHPWAAAAATVLVAAVWTVACRLAIVRKENHR